MWSGTDWRSYPGGTAFIATLAFFQFISLLGAFAKLRKRLLGSTCLYVCPSVLPHGTTRLPLNGTTRLPLNGTTRLPLNGTTRLPLNGTSRLPLIGTSRLPLNGTTRLPLNGTIRLQLNGTIWLSLNDFCEIWYLSIFKKSVGSSEVPLKSATNNRYFTWRPTYIYDNMSPNSSLNEKCFGQKSAEKVETDILCSVIFFFEKSCSVWGNVEKYGRVGEATDDNIIERMRFTCWITKATDTHAEYVMFISFPRQQKLRERASALRYTYIGCVVIYYWSRRTAFMPSSPTVTQEDLCFRSW